MARNRLKRRLTDKKNLAFIHVALNSATVTRFPILQSALVSIARIFVIAQKVRINTFEFMELAEDSLMLMVAISVKLMDQQEIDQSLKGNIEELLKALQCIISFGERRAAMALNPSLLTAILLEIRDPDAICCSRREVERCIRLFGVLFPLAPADCRLIPQYSSNLCMTSQMKRLSSWSNASKTTVSLSRQRIRTTLSRLVTMGLL
ncbi:hypothetical protein M378DRAFT_163785 [Amanita muscaria Koide BX008]|uniref:Uncharacterized protein n=1 Tax=Amanita muscaria (strain Koide BX008) TaxID=946122 RepID=A0A0C2X478_AMAMK|nr:hypothetical protein M378DRAFT_163785 [Amanita muscaria Koide BX008]